MNVSGLTPGDCVRIDRRGRVYPARFEEVTNGSVRVTPLVHNVNYFTVRPREIVKVWRQRPSVKAATIRKGDLVELRDAEGVFGVEARLARKLKVVNVGGHESAREVPLSAVAAHYAAPRTRS